ncbi:uncharacterized protein LOC106463357 isoform X3 [Limulus polyphemus]|uniref:Uncharacterized protein LOC106463357 isoform X3 n=1 Tax=Limulus polyphemus TaxID=6850 RepID=A0ABM1SSD9_LIMPO|nr:uncharacterized protein LOC106463357 isoform X3 [Limulus polyphemus]
MMELVSQPTSETSSDNEEINKIFPKCRIKSGAEVNNDVNQNPLSQESTSCSPSDLEKLNCETSMEVKNGQQLMLQGFDLNHVLLASRAKERRDDDSVFSGHNSCESSLHNDDSEKFMQIVDEKKEHFDVYDEEFDVGFSVGQKSEYALRESRIEIAGGREIFSKSRSRPSKKRYSDEVVYHPLNNYSGQASETKSHSGEFLYDERLDKYTFLPCAYRKSDQSSKRMETLDMDHDENHTLNKKDKLKLTDKWLQGPTGNRKVSISRLLNDNCETPTNDTLSSGHLVYEATLQNASIVYDDIGDITDRQKLNKRQFSGTKSNTSDKVFADMTQMKQLRNNRSQLPNSESSVYFYCDSNVTSDLPSQSDKKESPELSMEEMDTDSEPNSPEKQDIARVIGNVPIAQYEGSPRRYGPRPGFPQRVVTELHEEAYQNKNDSKNEHFKLCVDVKSNISNHAYQENSKFPLSYESPDKVHVERYKSENNFHCDVTNSISSHSAKTLRSEDFDHDITRDLDNQSPSLPVSGIVFDDLDYKLYRVSSGNKYIGKRLALSCAAETHDSPKRMDTYGSETEVSLKNGEEGNQIEADSSEQTACLSNEQELMLLHERVHQHTLQVEMSEQDRDSVSTYPGTEDLGETEIGEQVDHTRNFTLSPETTDCESNDVESEVSVDGSQKSGNRLTSSMPVLEDGLSSHSSDGDVFDQNLSGEEIDTDGWSQDRSQYGDNPTLLLMKKQINEIEEELALRSQKKDFLMKVSQKDIEEYVQRHSMLHHSPLNEADLTLFDTLVEKSDQSSPGLLHSPSEQNGHLSSDPCDVHPDSVSQVIQEIKKAIHHSKNIHLKSSPTDKLDSGQPVWVPRLSQGGRYGKRYSDSAREGGNEEEECDTDQETDRLLGSQRSEDKEYSGDKVQNSSGKKKGASKEVLIHEPAVLIEGVLFRARYLGSTQLVCEGQPTKATRMMQAEEAVSRIKAPEGETQPNTEVDLFISTEKIMVLNTDLKEIMMDHALRTISYIADIGDLVVLMARRRMMNGTDDSTDSKIKRTPKMICHVFESEEAQFIAQSIGQAFQVAYMEFLKANGIEDSSFVKEMDYQEVLNSQEIFGNELEMFAKKEKQKEVIVPKQKGEILGMVVVESGWGSMLPTVVIANMAQCGPAARCGQLNIGDQIIAINGVSLVGLPLSTCQNYIKNTKNQTVVKMTVVPCAPVVEVKIKRPDTKYQLGFSVQNGVICSLLRGGIAERGGVRVGHRIIEINGQSVVAVPHEKIVNLLATSVGEILMKTMPTSMFRLLTGQETPVYI